MTKQTDQTNQTKQTYELLNSIIEMLEKIETTIGDLRETFRSTSFETKSEFKALNDRLDIMIDKNKS
ncbi:hypothetical protein [Bacillus sp. CGMCC 1.16541]|uniref:hypothetical protein n=1 Tax=Bacillus sp. CGMCC 1.16541 TaxID=2185143 RepID=UPI000D736934|nr:hypothetical protein [Bacillus sp. CGMCC 1.16541]